ncbi:DoxX family protein [Arthrobacter castelli]|uniref:DoxX family protein n=1 Tax=Arthrobacter castelli TaxID=271431 RepID=UPI0004213F4A|nr:DoxX family protein [Arthrobacter castelli]
MKNAPNNTLGQLGLAVLRVVVGIVAAMHGWQKIGQNTIAGTTKGFAQMGIPAADIIAPIVAYLELFGGIALIIGLLTRPVALLLTIVMAGALFLVHLPAGFYAANGGYELVLMIGAAALALALTGPGRISIDRAFFGRRRSKASALA